MSNEKNYTPEEIKAIVNEELRKVNLSLNREISPDEMASVSGGEAYHAGETLRTHEDIDKAWDIIDGIKKNYGTDVATIAAQEMKVIPIGTNILELISMSETQER